MAYGHPARGGDVVLLCYRPVTGGGIVDYTPFTDARLKVWVPGGGMVIDAQLQRDAELDLPFMGDSGRQLILDLSTGDSVLHGMTMDHENTIAVPLFVPFGKHSGTWRFEYDVDGVSSSGTFTIVNACSAGASGPGILDFSSTEVFYTGDPEDRLAGSPSDGPGFENCRVVPNLIGLDVAEAERSAGKFAAENQMTLDFSVSGECTDGVVAWHGPDQHMVLRSRLTRVMSGSPAAGDDVLTFVVGIETC